MWCDDGERVAGVFVEWVYFLGGSMMDGYVRICWTGIFDVVFCLNCT